MTNLVAAILSIMLVMFFYMSISVMSVVAWVGVISAVVYVALEVSRSVASDTDYSWRDDKRFTLIYGCSSILTAMACAVFAINHIA